MRIVFFGTPLFAAKHLEFLLENGEEVVGIVTREDKPKGRSLQMAPTDVKVCAQKLAPQIPLFQPVKASTEEFIREMQVLEPDLFVVVAYGEIMSEALLATAKIASVNVHGSLLPKYRGAAPIQRALMNGDSVSGVTVMHMVKKMDAGPMIEQVEVPISSDMTAGELHDALIPAGCEGLLQALGEFREGLVKRIHQDEALVTYAKKITTEEACITFQASAEEEYNRFRGVTPFPGAWCKVNVRGKEKRVKILRCTPVASEESFPGKKVLYGNEGFVVGCSGGALRLDEVKLEGKKKVTGAEFARGFSSAELSIV